MTEPLSRPLPPGKKFVFLQCSTPFCAQAGAEFQRAVRALGGTPVVVNSGATAQTQQAAVSTVGAMKPDAVFLSTDPALFGSGLKKLSDAGTKVVSIQIAKDVKQYGIDFDFLGTPLAKSDGALLADWVIANKGPKADAVFYTVPAVDISTPMQQTFADEMKKNCPACKVRTVPIDISTIGTTSAGAVVSDLQAHPATNAAAFVILDVADGLPAALKAAGRDVATVGFGPSAANLQAIKDGGLSAGLAIDFPVAVWTALDVAARLVLGDKPTEGEASGVVPQQMLEQKDITFDLNKGWVGYPDYAARFTKLWHPAT